MTVNRHKMLVAFFWDQGRLFVVLEGTHTFSHDLLPVGQLTQSIMECHLQ